MVYGGSDGEEEEEEEDKQEVREVVGIFISGTI